MDKFIIILKYVLIALVQGIAEILPISSSGHMVIVQNILGLSTGNLSFEIFLHFASLIAIIAFFYKEIWLMIKSFFLFIFSKDKRSDKVTKFNFMLCLYLVVATIPAGIVVVLLNDFIGKTLSKVLTVGICLIITSIMLFVATKINKNKDLEHMNFLDAFIIGLFQCLGILPGISRSGSCMVGTSVRKINQSDGAFFAFIMAIPMMLGSSIFSLGDIKVALENTDLIIPYIIAFLVTLVVTYLSLRLFLKVVRKIKLSYFSIYCLIVGIISIIFGAIYSI